MTTSALALSDNGSVSLGGGITLTATGATIKGDPTLDQFWAGIQNCYTLANATQWAIGDLLLYGEGRSDWGEEYTQAVELTQKSYWTLTQAVRVSKAFPRDDREFAGSLSWSHHRILAGIKDLNDRRNLLQRCSDEALSCDDLRGVMPKKIAKDATPSTEGESHDITCPFCQRSFAL
jgi:hypothetical protein